MTNYYCVASVRVIKVRLRVGLNLVLISMYLCIETVFACISMFAIYSKLSLESNCTKG